MTQPSGRARQTRYAEPGDVEERAHGWTDEILLCRSYSHVWIPGRATHNKRWRYYRVVQRCQRCETERIMELSETGRVLSSTYDYSEGYLAVGLGRIAGDAKDVIRLASVLRAFPLEQLGAKASREDVPRAKSTREALGADDAPVIPIKRKRAS